MPAQAVHQLSGENLSDRSHLSRYETVLRLLGGANHPLSCDLDFVRESSPFDPYLHGC